MVQRIGWLGAAVLGANDGLVSTASLVGPEFAYWNGDVIRAAFLIDAHDREIIAWRAVANAGISGSDVRDMQLETVEKRFDIYRRHRSSRSCRTMAAPTPRRKPAYFPAGSASNRT
jgi:hypothetical protein